MTENTDFDKFVENQKKGLLEEREQALAEVEKAQAAVDELDRKLLAIDAYVAALTGEVVPQAAPRKRRTRSRTSRREEVLEVIRKSPNGLARGDILEALGVKGDKSAEQSVTNALSNMKKAGELVNEEGVYRVA